MAEGVGRATKQQIVYGPTNPLREFTKILSKPERGDCSHTATHRSQLHHTLAPS